MATIGWPHKKERTVLDWLFFNRAMRIEKNHESWLMED